MFSNFKILDWILFTVSLFGVIVGFAFFTLPEFVKREKETEKLGHIEFMTNQVRLRPAESFQWYFLSNWFKEEIHNHDQLFTEEDSTATVYLLSGDVVYVKPSSLVRFTKENDGELQLNVTYGEIKAEGPTINPPQIVKKKQKILLRKKNFEIHALEDKKIKNFRNEQLALESQEIKSPSTPNPILNTESPLISEPIADGAAEANKDLSDETPKPDPPEPAPATAAEPPAQNISKKPVPKRFIVFAEPESLEVVRPTVEERLKGSLPKIKTKWQPIKNVKLYSIQIYQIKNGKTNLVKNIPSPSPDLDIPFEQTGEFRIQVSAQVIAERRPASLPKNVATKDFLIPPLETLPRPAGIFPRDRQLLITSREEPIYFKWQRSVRFKIYMLQFSRDKDFTAIDKELLLSTYELKKNPQLEEGVWYWRVRGLSETGESPWGRPQEFKLVYE